MSYFEGPKISAETAGRSYSPEFINSPTYKKLKASGQLNKYNAKLAGLVESAIALKGEQWLATAPLNLLQPVQYEEPKPGNYRYTPKYREFVELVSGKKVKGNEEVLGDRVEEVVWKSFASVIEVAKSGASSWEEYVEKNKPGKLGGAVSELPRLAI